MDDEDFTITYVIDTIPNSPVCHKLPTQAKKNVWIVAIIIEDPITDQGALDDLNIHQTPCGKSKVKISLCRRQICQSTYLEDNHSIFYQVRPVV